MQEKNKLGQHMEKLLKLIADTPESDLDEFIHTMGALALGTLRARHGRKYLKGFCKGATDINADFVEVNKIKSH